MTSLPQLYIEPGYIYLPSAPINLYTVLGSCVAVCLWDKKLKIGGMNHFLYPKAPSKAKATLYYGNIATLQLIQMMEKAGSEKKSLLAQIVGGGDPPFETNNHSIGKSNIEIARKILINKGIKIVSEDVGGTMAEKLYLIHYTGHMIVLKVYQIRKDDWILKLPEHKNILWMMNYLTNFAN